jgi:hypothetical protein
MIRLTANLTKSPTMMKLNRFAIAFPDAQPAQAITLHPSIADGRFQIDNRKSQIENNRAAIAVSSFTQRPL